MEDFKNYSKEDYIKLYDRSLDELIDIAHNITLHNFNNEVEACSIISAKTGECPENCKYCSQSIHNHAKIECTPLLDVSLVSKAAKSARENGASRFCIVTSGRRPTDSDFEKIIEMIKEVKKIDGLHCCASLGLLTEHRLKELKKQVLKGTTTI